MASRIRCRIVERTPELTASLLSLIVAGSSFRKIEAELGIGTELLCDWIANDREFAGHYARVKEAMAERIASEIIEIADEADAENAQAKRLQVDARKWVAAKLLPKKYGDQAASVTVNNTTNVLVLPEEKRVELAERLKRLTGTEVKQIQD